MNGAVTSSVSNPTPDPEVPHGGSETNADTHYLSYQFTKMTPQQTKIALRINDDNLNHHLWNNRGVWWCHVTVHKPDATAERLRFSLKTRNIERARRLRDRIFEDIQRHFGIAA